MMCSVCLTCIYLCSEGHGGLKIRGSNQEHFSCLAVHIQQQWLIKKKGQLSICANVCISSTDSCHRRANRSVLYQGCSVYALSKNWSVVINILQREKSKTKTNASFYQHMQQTFMIQEKKTPNKIGELLGDKIVLTICIMVASRHRSNLQQL